jgi:hypothetical protein
MLVQRGEHNIENELRFSSHDGYVFHDSRGFESGDNTELEIVQEFVRRKSREKKLNQRLHAIWFAFVTLGIYGCKFADCLTGTAFRWIMTGQSSIQSILTKFAQIRMVCQNSTL